MGQIIGLVLQQVKKSFDSLADEMTDGPQKFGGMNSQLKLCLLSVFNNGS